MSILFVVIAGGNFESHILMNSIACNTLEQGRELQNRVLYVRRRRSFNRFQRILKRKIKIRSTERSVFETITKCTCFVYGSISKMPDNTCNRPNTGGRYYCFHSRFADGRVLIANKKKSFFSLRNTFSIDVHETRALIIAS